MRPELENLLHSVSPDASLGAAKILGRIGRNPCGEVQMRYFDNSDNERPYPLEDLLEDQIILDSIRRTAERKQSPTWRRPGGHG